MSLTEDLGLVDPLDADPELWDWDDEEPEDEAPAQDEASWVPWSSLLRSPAAGGKGEA